MHSLHLAAGANIIWDRSTVNSFHNWGISINDLADNLKPLCFSKDGMVEAFKVNAHSVWGLMWHPERSLAKNNDDIKIFQMMLEKDTK